MLFGSVGGDSARDWPPRQRAAIDRLFSVSVDGSGVANKSCGIGGAGGTGVWATCAAGCSLLLFLMGSDDEVDVDGELDVVDCDDSVADLTETSERVLPDESCFLAVVVVVVVFIAGGGGGGVTATLAIEWQ